MRLPISTTLNLLALLRMVAAAEKSVGNSTFGASDTHGMFRGSERHLQESTTLRSHHGTYLSGWDDGSLRLQGQAQGWEQWTKQSVGGGKVSLRSSFGRYLSAWPDGSVQTAGHSQEWEHWAEVQNGDGTVSLRSQHGTYLSAWTDGSVRLAPHNQEWEYWTYSSGNGGGGDGGSQSPIGANTCNGNGGSCFCGAGSDGNRISINRFFGDQNDEQVFGCGGAFRLSTADWNSQWGGTLTQNGPEASVAHGFGFSFTQDESADGWEGCCNICGLNLQMAGKISDGWYCEKDFFSTGIWLKGIHT